MMRVISVLMCFACGSVAGVYGEPGNQVVADTQEPSPSFRYRSDRYRDPFIPIAVPRASAEPSVQEEDVSPQTVRVVGTMSSAQGRWAVLEFDGGERLIVTPGQVIAAHSRVVKDVTEQGVTLSAIGETAKSQAENTYWLDEERDLEELRSGGNS